MPINPSTRTRNSVSGTAKLSHGQQMVALFGYPGLPDLGTALDGLMPGGGERRRGRTSPYPATALLAVMASARVAGSLSMALQTLDGDRELWRRCAAAFERISGHPLPAVPPSRDQMRYLRDRLVKQPGRVLRLQDTFMAVSVGQARLMGNLTPGVEPDWARPDWRHAIHGDGTNISKYSEVREVVHPGTGEIVLVGSRAKDPQNARIQRLASDTEPDGKVSNGLNMVAMHTWTQAGRVVLGTAVALDAELWTALELIEQIHRLAGDGLHSVIYDRAITGEHVANLMADFRVQVIGKAVGANSEYSAWDTQAIDRDVKEMIDRQRVELLGEREGVPNSDFNHILRHDVLADMLRYHDRLPLGLSIYPTSGRRFDLVRSWSRELEPFSHEVDGQVCSHRLAIDDGGLFEIDEHPDGSGPVKTRLLRCLSSRPVQRQDGRWGTRNEYAIPCGSVELGYVRTWEPRGVRSIPHREALRSANDPIGWRLRPLSRADDIAAWYNDDPGGHVDHFSSPRPFSEFFGRRNDSESYNEWYQRSLPHHGRAATPDPAAQELDFLLGGVLNNAITWHHWKQG